MKNTKNVRWCILALAICSAILCGCSDARGRSAVQKKYAGAQVAMVPDKSGHYIIKKQDGSVWYAYCAGVSAEPGRVCDDVELIPATTK